MDFGKVITAMVTPFHADKNKICKKRVHHLVNHLIKNGSEGLVVAGTTGEAPTLSHEEKMKLFTQTIETTAGRAKIIVGTGSNDTAGTVAFTNEVAKLGNIDAALIVAPYYNKPNQKGIYAHFKEVAENVALPIMIYNIPGRTGINIEPETIIALSKLTNIVSVKESSGNLDNISKIIAETDGSFTVYSGDDSLTLPILSVGGTGIVSVASHLAGKELQKMIAFYMEGRVKEAAKVHQKLLPFIIELFKTPNPAPIKYLLNQQGIEVGSVRLPLVDVNKEEQCKTLEAVFNQLKNTFS